MAALIDDLLAFSRLNRQSLNRQTVDMTAWRAASPRDTRRHPGAEAGRENRGACHRFAGGPLHSLRRYGPTHWHAGQIQLERPQHPEVQVCAATEGSLVRYEVRDKRVGFDMKYVDQAVLVFFSVCTTQRSIPGLASDSPSSKGSLPPRGRRYGAG